MSPCTVDHSRIACNRLHQVGFVGRAESWVVVKIENIPPTTSSSTLEISCNVRHGRHEAAESIPEVIGGGSRLYQQFYAWNRLPPGLLVRHNAVLMAGGRSKMSHFGVSSTAFQSL